jgi:SAM-dependent methyltransferase
MEPRALRQRLVDAAAERYRPAGRFAYHFARGKLAGDPVFGALLAQSLVPDRARILDLGCGQGLLASWLVAAEEFHRAGDWYAGWPPPPAAWSFRGIELMPRAVSRARPALAAVASVEVGDIRTADFRAADTVVIFDVLHYMDTASQQAVLGRVRATLSAAGVLLLRIGDAGGGLPFRISNWVDRTVLAVRGRGSVRLRCRSLTEWIGLLERLGFRTDAIPMSANTPFANVLLVARPR